MASIKLQDRFLSRFADQDRSSGDDDSINEAIANFEKRFVDQTCSSNQFLCAQIRQNLCQYFGGHLIQVHSLLGRFSGFVTYCSNGFIPNHFVSFRRWRFANIVLVHGLKNSAQIKILLFSQDTKVQTVQAASTTYKEWPVPVHVPVPKENLLGRSRFIYYQSGKKQAETCSDSVRRVSASLVYRTRAQWAGKRYENETMSHTIDENRAVLLLW